MSAAENTAAVVLLRELREEVRDWQDALGGEREGLNDLCARVDAVLDTIDPSLIAVLQDNGWTQDPETGVVSHPEGMDLPTWRAALVACIEVASGS